MPDDRGRAYLGIYQAFDSPLFRRIRAEAYGEDVGQHSWVTATELRADAGRLSLSADSDLVDLGAGPCGPLTFLVGLTGCHGTAIELMPEALEAGRRRAAALGVSDRIAFVEGDLSRPLPFPAAGYHAAVSLDVVLHLPDRAGFFREVARILRPGGRFLLTDAGVVTGAVSNAEIRERSAIGPLHLVPPGVNEALLEDAGFKVLEVEDRTASAGRNAAGRLSAIAAHRAELADLLGDDWPSSQARYLETVVELSRRRALSRFMYLAERTGPR